MSAQHAAATAGLPDLAPVVAEFAHPLVFATVSGNRHAKQPSTI